MKHNLLRRLVPALTAIAAMTLSATDLVRVSDGQLMIGDRPYTYVGTNLWYAPILASDGAGSDPARLSAELDSLQALGIDNLRILAGGEGNRTQPCHIEPNLQTAPGVYNDTLLVGLDRLLAELERRDMRAVIYLTNAWEWSGGYGTYLEWLGKGDCPLPTRDGYKTYVNYVADFVLSDSARAMYDNHVRTVVGRVNSVTGRPYSESPAIMSWQVCNEPRAFSQQGKPALADWLRSTARLIKSIDPNHLVSTGSEGLYGCEVDMELWRDIHLSPEIDYATIHIWPYNWRWVDADRLIADVDSANCYTRGYIAAHREALGYDKPLVLEEFGYPRDNMEIAPGTPVQGRDIYYDYVLGVLRDEPGLLNGINFWGWGGEAVPPHRVWQAGDPFTCDPAHEDQGLYSVFGTDNTTKEIIRKTNSTINSQIKTQVK